MKKKFDWSQLRQRVGKKKKNPTNWIITIITIIAMVCSLSVCCVNSYQRTQMNLRGLSCWMLPSRPDSPLGLLPFGQGALAAARPRRCLHFTPTPPACFTFWRLWLSHASARLLSTPAAARLESASPILPCLARLPACLPRLSVRLGVCGAPAAAYTEGAADKNSQDRKNTARIRLSGAHRTDWICRSRRVPCRDRLWFPCATLRIVINTLHCSVDAPS